MVPGDHRSPFKTSGIRLGTPAITTRGVKEDGIKQIVKWIDTIINNIDNEQVIERVRGEVNEMMSQYPLMPEIESA